MIRRIAVITTGRTVDRTTGSRAFRAQLVVPEMRQLYDYWLERAGDNTIPCRADINPCHVPRLLAGISLVDVAEDIEQSRVRLAGTRLREVYDREITGLAIGALLWGNRRDYWMAAYRRTVESAQPTQGILRGPQVNKEHVVQYWLRLPLRTLSDTVGMVLCYDYFVPASEIALENDLAIA
jgi:hypothetical protein